MVYHKNTKIQVQVDTIGELLSYHNIPHTLPELNEEPFKRLPISVLVDLYEYV